MDSKDDRCVLSNAQVEALAKELASAISASLARSRVLGGFNRFAYNCTGDEFECLNEYHCHDPHDCHGKFGCPGSFICTHVFGG